MRNEAGQFRHYLSIDEILSAGELEGCADHPGATLVLLNADLRPVAGCIEAFWGCDLHSEMMSAPGPCRLCRIRTQPPIDCRAVEMACGRQQFPSLVAAICIGDATIGYVRCPAM